MRLLWVCCLLLAWVADAWADYSLEASQGQYARDESVIIKYSGLPGNPQDWIVITRPWMSMFRPGERKQYTDGAEEGEMDFGVLPPGEYEARLYLDYPTGGYHVYARALFQVERYPATSGALAQLQGNTQQAEAAEPEVEDTSPAAEPSLASFMLLEPIVVNFRNLPITDTNLIGLSNPSRKAYLYPDTAQEVKGQAKGTLTFENIYQNAGDYEVRLYFNWPYGRTEIIARAPFKVTEPETKVSTDKTTYELDEDVVVTFSGFPGYRTDWVSIAGKKRPDSFYDRTGIHFKRTGGVKEGEYTFSDFEPGDYEVRAYYNFPLGGFAVKARSEFTVIDPDEAEQAEQEAEDGGDEEDEEDSEDKEESEDAEDSEDTEESEDADKIDDAEESEDADKTDDAEESEDADKTDDAEESEDADKTDDAEESEDADKTDDAEESEDADKTDDAEESEDADKTDDTEESEDADKTDDAEESEDADKTDDAEESEDADKTDDAEESEDADKTDDAEESEDAEDADTTDDAEESEDTDTTDEEDTEEKT